MRRFLTIAGELLFWLAIAFVWDTARWERERRLRAHLETYPGGGDWRR